MLAGQHRDYGEYLDALVDLLGDQVQDRQAFITNLRDDFACIVAAPAHNEKTRYQKAEALYNLIYKGDNLS